MDDISRRKRLILAQIVALHSGSGDPVGSKLLQEFLGGVSVSTATLRNEMAQLTELGLLEQPHTSAGRVPTVQGYRYFLNNLMTSDPLEPSEKRAIASSISEMDSDPDKASEFAADELAELSGLGAITTTPVAAEIQMNHFDLIKVGRYSIAVLGITNLGSLKSRICRTASELPTESLNAVGMILNRTMCFRSYEDLDQDDVLRQLASIGESAVYAVPVARAAAELLESASAVRVHRSGQRNLLNFREIAQDVDEVVRLFEDTDMLAELLSREGDIDCYVGDELGSGYSSLSLVIGRYRVAGGGHGGLALVGPVRMNYSRVIPRLKYYCDAMSEALAAR